MQHPNSNQPIHLLGMEHYERGLRRDHLEHVPQRPLLLHAAVGLLHQHHVAKLAVVGHALGDRADEACLEWRQARVVGSTLDVAPRIDVAIGRDDGDAGRAVAARSVEVATGRLGGGGEGGEGARKSEGRRRERGGRGKKGEGWRRERELREERK